MSTGSETIADFGMINKKTAILYITDNGLKLAERLKVWSPDAEIVKFVPAVVKDLWAGNDALVFIMASGIVVRTIAPLLKNKKTDPAVVVLDDAGRFAISLVSGHLGGANELAEEIAKVLHGEAVITTASDVNGLPSIDLWARDHDLVVENWDALPIVSTRYINNGALRIYCDVPVKLPDEFLRVVDPRFADVIVTNQLDVYKGAPRCSIIGEGCAIGACKVKGQVYLRPRNLSVGIGCNSNTSQEELEAVVSATLIEQNLSFLSIAGIATIDIKADEPGLKAFCAAHNFTLRTYRSDELNRIEGLDRSEIVFKATGAYAVAEPAALLAGSSTELLVRKQKKGNVTIAVAKAEREK